MKKILYIASFLLVTLSCVDENYKFYEKKEISGTAYLLDDMSGTDKIIASNKIIRLCTDSAGENYVLTDTTNVLGEFKFDFKPEGDTNLYLFCETKDKDIKYKFSQPIVNNENIIFDIKASYKNGVKVNVKSSDNEPINNINVYMFRNLDAAKSARGEKDSTKIRGFERTKKTNKYGVAFFGDIDSLSGTTPKYHILLMDFVNKRTYLKENINSDKSKTNDIIGSTLNKEFILKNNLTNETVKGGIKFELLDAGNKVIKSDSVNQGSILRSSFFYEGTNSPVIKIKGKASIEDVDYEGELVDLNKSVLELSSINLNTVKVNVKNINLPISGISVYLFKNLQSARLASKTLQPIGSIKKTTTNLNGVAYFTKLNEIQPSNSDNQILIIHPDKKISYLIENVNSNSNATTSQDIIYSSITENVIIRDNILEENLLGDIEATLVDNNSKILSVINQSNSNPIEFNYFFMGSDPKHLITANATIKGIKYSGDLSNFSTNNLTLESEYQNSIKVKLSSKNGDILRNLKIFLYDNLDIANAALLKENSNASISESTTNSKGIAVFGNLDAGKYHLLILNTINGVKFNDVIQNINIDINNGFPIVQKSF